MSYINSKPRRLTCKTQRPDPEPEYPMRGLGDLVEKVTTKTGIKAVVDKVAKVTGKDCGCGKRRDKLNQLVPFKKEDGNE
jgi:hypothetical protein